MSEDLLLVERDGPIATVIFNRPERRNAVNLAVWRGIGDIMNDLSNEDDLRCIVLRGAGDKSFVAGADISEFENNRKGRANGKIYGTAVTRAMHAIGECRHPTVAMIKGFCIGGGVEIATRCDIRVCGTSSKFGIPSNKLGLVVSHAELDALVAVVGRAFAYEILLRGEIFDADYAYRMGLVHHLVADDAVETTSLEIARGIAERSPLTNRWHKAAILRAADPTPISDSERDSAYDCYDSADFQEGYSAFLAKRQAIFKGK